MIKRPFFRGLIEKLVLFFDRPDNAHSNGYRDLLEMTPVGCNLTVK